MREVLLDLLTHETLSIIRQGIVLNKSLEVSEFSDHEIVDLLKVEPFELNFELNFFLLEEFEGKGFEHHKSFCLGDTNLSILPESIGNLRNLKKLYLYYTNLSVLPESIGNLKKLRELYLGGTNIPTLPSLLASTTG